MKPRFTIALFGFALFLSGCFIRIPTSGSPEQRANVGRTGVLVRELILVNFLASNVAWELGSESNLGKNQRVVARLAKGAPVAIKSISYRRLPHGVFYDYICKESVGGRTFELSVSMLDAIEFSDAKKRANQSPQTNAGSRPSSNDSPASETPFSLGPRG